MYHTTVLQLSLWNGFKLHIVNKAIKNTRKQPVPVAKCQKRNNSQIRFALTWKRYIWGGAITGTNMVVFKPSLLPTPDM